MEGMNNQQKQWRNETKHVLPCKPQTWKWTMLPFVDGFLLKTSTNCKQSMEATGKQPIYSWPSCKWDNLTHRGLAIPGVDEKPHQQSQVGWSSAKPWDGLDNGFAALSRSSCTFGAPACVAGVIHHREAYGQSPYGLTTSIIQLLTMFTSKSLFGILET